MTEYSQRSTAGTIAAGSHATTSFHNTGSVGSQVHSQNVSGDVNHYHYNYNVQDKRARLNGSDPSLEKSLDDDILTSLSYPEMFYRRADIHMPFQTTCQWVFDLEQYKTWASQPTGLLWIKGKPGAGKSTLMAHLYREIRQKYSFPETICLEFFFTARGSPLQRTTLGMLRSLLSQIFYNDMASRYILREAYREKQGLFGATQRVWEWRQPELEKVLTEVIVTSAPRRPLVIFIDALDEAGKEAAREMARYFHSLNDQLHERVTTTKICISCRHFPVVPRFQAVEICVEDHNRNDIAAYIQGRLNVDSLSSDNVFDEEGLKILVQSLLDAAGGIFQWVYLVVPMVEDLVLQGYSLAKLQVWLKRVPPELSQIYEQTIRELMDSSHSVISILLFYWVCLAIRPLSLTEIQHGLVCHVDLIRSRSETCHSLGSFIGKDELTKAHIRSWSGGLIEATSTEGGRILVQPIHQSVKEFFSAEGWEILAQFESRKREFTYTPNASLSMANEIASRQSELYWCCLGYLAENAKRILSVLNHGDSTYQNQNLTRSELDAKFPFLEYVLDGCLAHAEKAHGYTDDQLMQQAQMLGSSTPLWWRLGVLYQRTFREQFQSETTPLHIAAFANMSKLAYHLVESGIAVDLVDESGRTALHIAARQGHLETVQMLVASKADIHREDGDHRTPLVLAAGCDGIEVFTWLLKQGAHLYGVTETSEPVLHAAAVSRSKIMISICIDAGAEVNAQGGDYGNALQAASYCGNTEIVQMLLDAGAEVNAQGGYYGNALQATAASYYGNIEIAQILLDAGAEVNAQGGYHGNALQAASYCGNTEIVQMLHIVGAVDPGLEEEGLESDWETDEDEEGPEAVSE